MPASATWIVPASAPLRAAPSPAAPTSSRASASPSVRINPASASASASPSATRSAGSFASSRIVSCASPSGIPRPGAAWRGSSGRTFTCCARISMKLAPTNGSEPVSSSYKITPTL